MLFGRPGVGKSTLAAGLADRLVALGRTCHCLCADPGTPAFGSPGVLALGARSAGNWETRALKPLCSLDAGRLRLPLVAAVRRLLSGLGPGVLLLDSPGVVRGMAGRESLHALVEVVGVDLVLAIESSGRAVS